MIAALAIFEAAHHHAGMQLNQFIVTRIHDAKHEGASTTKRRYQRLTTVNNAGGWAGEAGKDQPGHQRKAHESHQRFNGYQQVGGEAVGTDVPIANGCQGVHTEEVGAQKKRYTGIAYKSLGTKSDVANGEDGVEGDIDRQHVQKEFPPGHGNQGVIAEERSPEGGFPPLHVESAIMIQQAEIGAPRKRVSETKIAVLVFHRKIVLLDCAQRFLNSGSWNSMQ